MRPSDTLRNSWRKGRLAAIVLLLMVLAGSSLNVAATTAKSPSVAPDESETDEIELLDLDPANFDDPTVIDNEWLPMKPGTQLIYAGFHTEENGEQIPHVVVITVTDMTKVVNGVRTLVSIEEDYSDEELVEKELVFHAQDNDGNVWHLGQLVEVYEEGSFIGAHFWLVGVTEGAHAGMRVLAEPQVGDAYSQGYAPAPYYWTDAAQVYQTGQQTTVAAGSYDDVMVLAEWDQETEEGVFQDKYHAPGVGVVRVGFRGPDPEREEMELVGIEQLNPVEMADLRAEVLRIEERAYLYGSTDPAEQG